MSTESTLERAVEQLAGCLAKETKVSSRGQSTTARKVAYPLVMHSLTFSPRRFSRQLQTPTKYIFLESSLIGELIGWSFVHFTATLRCSVVKTGQNFRVPAAR